MTLTPGEQQSPVWQKLKAHYEERLHILRAENDAAMPEVRTANQRGRIAEIKALLQLGEPNIVVDA